MSDPTPPHRGPLAELGRFLEIQNLGLNATFAVAFLLVAAHGAPSVRTIVLIVVAFVAARNAGHGFNRWADRAYDAANPRTRDRALVTGRYSPRMAFAVVALSSATLLVAAYLLNPLAFLLSPVALLLLFGYSYSKRFTAWTTVYLGLVEAITPAGAYIGVTGTLPPVALLAVVGMLLWGTAFETIHSLGDVDTDRAAGLRSIPAKFGVERSAKLVPFFHAGALIALAGYALATGLGPALYAALAVMTLFVGVVDRRVLNRPTDPTGPFRLHYLLGAIFLVGVVLALLPPTGWL